jgi:hypothetical protein
MFVDEDNRGCEKCELHDEGRHGEEAGNAQEDVLQICIKQVDVGLEDERAQHRVESYDSGLPGHAIPNVPAPRFHVAALA